MRTLILLFFIIISSFGVMFGQERQTYTERSLLYEGEAVAALQLRPVNIFAPMVFKNKKEKEKYTRLMRDVSVAYPYAQMVAASIIETYEYMETLPDEKAKQKHLEAVQKYLMDTYKPRLKKMTRKQGQILIKLIDRQCNTSSYSIVASLVGSFKAGVYNTFAGLFGNSLKTEYDPLGKDKDIEHIVIQIEDGTYEYYYSSIVG